MKSRKRKESLRRQLRYFLEWSAGKGAPNMKSSEIKYIWDDFFYWMCRYFHKELHPNTPDNFYLVSR